MGLLPFHANPEIVSIFASLNWSQGQNLCSIKRDWQTLMNSAFIGIWKKAGVADLKELERLVETTKISDRLTDNLVKIETSNHIESSVECSFS